MKYLARYRYIAFALCALLLLQGCDWVKSRMGMPTSEDIERMRIEIQQQEMERIALQEAEARRIKDSLDLVAAEAAKKPSVEGFYVVLGSFKDYRNADALEALVKKHGYSPEKIMMKNGFMMVAIGGFGSFSKAYKEMEKIGEQDFCPYDMWVYGASQGLHQD